jgi:very-short-patch-repair endonuclease
MDAAAARLDGRPGVRNLRRVLAASDARSESPGETLTRDLITRLRLPPPEPQVKVLTRLGSHRLDFAWRQRRIALEFDGKTKYFDYRPTREVLFEERRREKALTEDGWLFVRVEWKDLFREQEFLARLMRAFASRPAV